MAIGVENPSYYLAYNQDVNQAGTAILMCGKINGGPLQMNSLVTGFVMEMNMNLVPHYVHTINVDTYFGVPEYCRYYNYQADSYITLVQG